MTRKHRFSTSANGIRRARRRSSPAWPCARGSGRWPRGGGSGVRVRRQRLALPPDELRPAGHRHPRVPEDHGDKVGRVALFGIPLQQTWSYGNTGDFAPTYYLQTDAPLYYYSFTDAYIAMAYRSLTPAEQARFDPMITGFNPADMYAADHIRRVLQTFPGVFRASASSRSTRSSSRPRSRARRPASPIRRSTASSISPPRRAGRDPAQRHRHAVPEAGAGPLPLPQIGDLFRRHPKTTIIWAHCGLGRIVHPVKDQVGIVERALDEPRAGARVLRHLVGRGGEVRGREPGDDAGRRGLINRHPDRFLFGTDEVAPTEQAKYLKVYDMYAPLFAKLTPEASEKVRRATTSACSTGPGVKVRAWEKAKSEMTTRRNTDDESNEKKSRAASEAAASPPVPF